MSTKLPILDTMLDRHRSLRDNALMRVYIVLKRELVDDRLDQVQVVGVFSTSAAAATVAAKNGADEIQEWEVSGALLATIMT